MKDYKAIICINLNGGNDGVNTVVPITPEYYDAYYAIRPHLALVGNEIDPIGVVDKNGTELGINAELTGLAQLIRDGYGSVVCNIGPLVEPTSRATWNSVVRPQSLFNHGEQHRIFHTDIQSNGTKGEGWGGQIMQALADSGVERAESYAHSINALATGTNRSVNIDSSGVPAAGGGLKLNNANDGKPYDILQLIRGSEDSYDNYLQKQYCGQVEEITSTDEVVQQAVIDTPLDERISRSSGLGRGISNVKRVIDSASKYGAQRQLFNLSLGGFDNHSNLKASHKRRFNELGSALSEFLGALKEDGLIDNVVVFTTSEFGRRVRGNATGSDHGWGSHSLLFGGAIKKGEAVGVMPKYDLEGEHMISGQDRLIPDISHEQLGATLAKWMGLNDEQITEIFTQGAEHFEMDLGFLQ